MTRTEELLTEYALTGSEAAFRELLTLYVDLVYSAAVRVVGGDSHLAEDVTQTVFVHLARKAHSLPKHVMLGGWLHRHTVFVALNVVRREQRRRTRERQAAEMNALEDHTQANLRQIAPALDEAIDQLAQTDRAALLLRFFEQLDFRSVGEALGSSEEAARKRVSRALEKLEALLQHRGVSLSAAALATMLASEAVGAAPPGLAGAIAGAALTSTTAGGITSTIFKLLSMTKLKLGILGTLALAGVAIPWMIQHQAQAALEERNEAVRRQMDQLAAENIRLSTLVSQAHEAQTLTRDEVGELLRLRGETGRLRERNRELEQLQSQQVRTAAAGAQSQLDQTNSSPGVYLRVIKVDTEKLLRSAKSFLTTADGESNSEILRRFFQANAIEAAAPATVVLDERTGTVILRASLENLDKTEELLKRFAPNDQSTTEDSGPFHSDAQAAR